MRRLAIVLMIVMVVAAGFVVRGQVRRAALAPARPGPRLAVPQARLPSTPAAALAVPLSSAASGLAAGPATIADSADHARGAAIEPAAGALAPPAATPVTVQEAPPAAQDELRTVRVPILMYHYISSPPPGADAIRRDLSVPPDRFESQLRYLHDAGYHVISLDDVYAALRDGRPLPEKPVVLTFDDGHEDNYTQAFPLLEKYGMHGCFFVITDWATKSVADYVTWPQVEEMARAGEDIESHTRDHTDLRKRSVAYLQWEALGGIEAIQQHVGRRPHWIAYPSGMYDAQTIAVYQSAGYWGGVTTHQGALQRSSALFELKRVRVHGSFTAGDLASVLALNW